MNKKTQNIITALLLGVAGIFGLTLSILMHSPKPSVQTEDPNHQYHHPVTFVASLENDKDTGKKIFHEFCGSCHSRKPVIPVGAPRIGDKKAWRFYRKMSVEQLLAILKRGAGPMPARGGCFECSDEQLKLTIQYILDNT